MVDFLIGLGCFFGGYLCGSIPTGYLLVQLFLKEDIRTTGSGNIGATNVYRRGRRDVAIATLLLDAAKAIIPILLIKYYVSDTAALWAGLAAVIGHVFPVWLKFKGGKGVATAIGFYLGIFYPMAIFGALLWYLVFYYAKIVSLSSLAMVFFVPVFSYIFHDSGDITIVNILITFIIFYAHRENILRLIVGEEKPVSQSSSSANQEGETSEVQPETTENPNEPLS